MTKMRFAESMVWAGSLTLLGLLLPSLLQLRIELHGWHQGFAQALQAVIGKWQLATDSLDSVTRACMLPFVALAVGCVACSRVCSRRTTVLLTLAGLAIVLFIWVPLGIHHLKLVWTDNAPPFESAAFIFVSFYAIIPLVALLVPFFFRALANAVLEEWKANRK